MKKETLHNVDKVWGEEIWLVNSPEYCSKFLVIDQGAKSSYHYHRKKRETFYGLEGYVTLIVEGKQHLLAPFTRPKTIEPKEKHSFEAITQAVVLEVSTYHTENDVYRETESRVGGMKCTDTK